MKNKRIFISVVVVFVVLLAFFVFFYGFRSVRTQFGVVQGPSVMNKAVGGMVSHSMHDIHTVGVNSLQDHVTPVKVVEGVNLASARIVNVISVSVLDGRVSRIVEQSDRQV